MSATTTIDEMFRQKTLQEIHVVLKDTRSQVETRKQELRELVGDHYRSVLESADHIRAMSANAAKVSANADRFEELVTSMRSLSSNMATTGSGAPRRAKEKSEEVESAYRASLRIMDLLEIPDTMRGHLHDFRFVDAARTVLVDLATLQNEVQGRGEFAALAQQSSFLSLRQQLAASCMDAFGAVNLQPASAVESLAVSLLLDSQPVPLLRTFIERRKELIRNLLDVGGAPRGDTPGTRLAAAVMAFEGTVVLSCGLCPVQGEAISLGAVLAKVLADAPRTDADERAAIEGRPEDSGLAALKKRAETLRNSLKPGSPSALAMASELKELGSALARSWTTNETASFARLVVNTQARSRDCPPTCAVLSRMRDTCLERVREHRQALAGGNLDSWPAVWEASCRRFCTEPLKDVLEVVQTTLESTGADVVRERVGDLQLDLVPAEEASDVTVTDEARRNDIGEFQRQSQQCVAHFDEELGDVVADFEQLTGVSIIGMVALLSSVRERLCSMCDSLDVPPNVQLSAVADEDTARITASWAKQRGAARIAIALDALKAAAVGGDTDAGNVQSTRLSGLLQKALAFGDPRLAEDAQTILAHLDRRCGEAYASWASMIVVPHKCTATFEGLCSLADDELGPSCGWGNAKFGSTDGNEEIRSVPVPVQVSPFVFEHLTEASRRVLEVSAHGMPRSLIVALKVSLCETFVALYTPEIEGKHGMPFLLQWLFDLRFLRVALSLGSSTQPQAHDALCDVLKRVEEVTLSDPVDRLLYQEVLKTSVQSHIEGVKVVLAPFFMQNPLFNFLQGRGPVAEGTPGLASATGDGFELQATFAAPLRPMLPRFPLLPVAMASSLSAGVADFDSRLGLPGESGDRMGSRSGTGPGGAGTKSLIQQVGSGLESFGLAGMGKAFPLGGMLGWGGDARPPTKAV